MSPGARRGPSPATCLPPGPSVYRRTRCCLPAACLSVSRYRAPTEAGTPWRQGTARGTGLTSGQTAVLSEQGALCWPPRGMEGGEPDSSQPGARLWVDGRGREGSHGGQYLGSACSAPGAAPGRAPAARGRSGPGQAPHWGREREQGRWGCLLEPCSLAARSTTACLSPLPRVGSCLPRLPSSTRLSWSFMFLPGRPPPPKTPV